MNRWNFNSKSSLRIGGKMSERGADKAGGILAYCVGAAALVFSIAALIYAVRWW